MDNTVQHKQPNRHLFILKGTMQNDSLANGTPLRWHRPHHRVFHFFQYRHLHRHDVSIGSIIRILCFVSANNAFMVNEKLIKNNITKWGEHRKNQTRLNSKTFASISHSINIHAVWVEHDTLILTLCFLVFEPSLPTMQELMEQAVSETSAEAISVRHALLKSYTFSFLSAMQTTHLNC